MLGKGPGKHGRHGLRISYCIGSGLQNSGFYGLWPTIVPRGRLGNFSKEGENGPKQGFLVRSSHQIKAMFPVRNDLPPLVRIGRRPKIPPYSPS